MNNLETDHDKLVGHLQELYKKHRELDDEIELLYNKFAPDSTVNMLKTKKLWIKDEINLYENKLRALAS
jgi:hypothetical protein